jgi:manganese efflux pump family protein
MDGLRRGASELAAPVMELSWIALLGLSVGLAADAFAVAVAAGLVIDTITPRHVFRLGFHFGLFQFMMPILGWLAGEQLATHLGDSSRWLAFALLGYVGGKMLWEARGEKNDEAAKDPTRGLTLLTLSLATSLDALAVGMSMALLGVSVWLPSVVIGLVTATLTAVGVALGGRIGSRWAHWAEAAGGVVLILLGLKLLLLG